jgi:hypothetical protein
MTTIRELSRQYHKQRREAQFLGERRGLTGKEIGTNQYTIDGGLPAGMIWVRLDGRRDATAVYGPAREPNIPIIVRPDASGQLYVYGADYPQVGDSYGGAVEALLTPVAPNQFIGDVVDGRRLMPGRIRLSDIGGLTAYVEGFSYQRGYFAGSVLTLVPTATASMQSQCTVYFNPATGTLAQLLGTDFGLAFNLTLDEVHPPPPSMIPLAAVRLYNGQTALAGTEFQDIRHLWGAPRSVGERLYLASNFY